MHGVTTALVAFLLICVIFPKLIKERNQYYAAFWLVCAIIFVDALGLAVGGKFAVVMYFINAVLQIGTLCILFLAAGGITWGELGSEMLDAFEVVRRGEDTKEVIVPLRGEQPKQKEAPDISERIVLEEPPSSEDRSSS